MIYDHLRQALGSGQRAIESKAIRLVDPLFLSHRAVSLFGMKDWWRRTGCVAANSTNFEQAVKDRRIVIVSAEGVAGIAKGPRRKYQLQRFSSSFLRLAHSYGALVVPVSVINAEYLNPSKVCIPQINRLGRRLGFPFVPLGGGTLQALVPASYLTPRPAKLTYVMHSPIPFESGVQLTYRELRDEAEAFRKAHQQRLDADVRLHHAPYHRAPKGTPDLHRSLRPYRWHEMFLRTADESPRLAALYKIPLSYPLISLARRFAKQRSKQFESDR